MNGTPRLKLSERWFRLLVKLYPVDFRDEMGNPVAETYLDRARAAWARRGRIGVAGIWVSALWDAIRNGPGERLRPAVAWRRAGDWARDAEHASRRLRRAPGTMAAIVATLTIGLGMFAVVYTVVQKILIAPMPYRNPDDLYFVWRDYGPIFDLKRGWLGGTDVAELQKAGGVIEGATGLGRQLSTFAARETDDPMEISVITASPNIFDLLGVSPMLGRGFLPNEVGPGRTPSIVLTHDLWRKIGSDPAIIGKDIRLNGSSYVVLGVMPRDFAFVRNASLGAPQRADAFITFNIHLHTTNPGAGSYAGLIRARHGTSPEVVSAAVASVGKTVDTRDFRGRGLKLYPVGLKPDLVSDVKPALIVLGAAGVFLLLVLMVNLGTVLLARAAQREQEYAVSRALGANSAAIARATLFEGGLLGLLGGIAAAVVAIWGTRTLVALAPLTLPRKESIAVDWPIAAAIVAVGTLLGLFAATAPAVWAARTSLASLLARSAVRGGGGGHGRMRRSMVVVQVALTLVLLSSGGLVVRSFDRLLRAAPGFRPEGVLTMRVPIPVQFAREVPDVVAMQQRIEDALAAVPGAKAVSATSALPLAAGASQTTIGIPGAPGNSGNEERDRPLVDWLGIRAGYVELMGMRLVEGRTFERTRPAGVQEVIVDTQLARHFFPNGGILGTKIPFGGKDQFVTVVGVVEQARLYDVHKDSRPQMYVRQEDGGFRQLSFVIRSDRDLAALGADARAAIRQLDARLAVADIKPMDAIVKDAVRQQRISAVLIAGFALGALLLAAMGLFGVVSGSVTRRRHEFAVRLALGADHRRVLRLVLGEGARLLAIGLLIGAPGIYFAAGLLRGMLIGISPLDPATIALVAVGLALVALVACYVPARRVLSLEPAQSLRQE
jgi:putative ABC transport system permease protein